MSIKILSFDRNTLFATYLLRVNRRCEVDGAVVTIVPHKPECDSREERRIYVYAREALAQHLDGCGGFKISYRTNKRTLLYTTPCAADEADRRADALRRDVERYLVAA